MLRRIGRELAVIVCTMAAAMPAFTGSAQLLFSDDFMSDTLDTSKWRIDAQPFESGVSDIAAVVGGGSITFSGVNSAGWWGGSAVATVPTFTASPETNLVFEVTRVNEFGIGTASRSAIWITDAERKNFVFFGDNRGEGNWRYNRKIGATGDNPTGSGTAISAFNVAPYTDGGSYVMKAVVNGQSVKLYLDGIFGAEVEFPFASGIVFEMGGYARAVDDSASATFATPSVTAAQTILFTDNAGTIQNTSEVLVGLQSTNISIKIPAGQNTSQSFTVRVVTSDPTVALPIGAVGDTLTITFPAGGPTIQSVPVQALRNGAATLTLQNDAGVLIGNSLYFMVPYSSAGILLQDDFSGASYDATKWTLNTQGFESGTGDMTVSTTGGQLVMSGGLSAQYWGGVSLKTVTQFVASKDLPLVFEMDRVSLTQSGTSARTGAFITTSDRSQYVFFGHNYPENGWSVNVTPDTSTGAGTRITAFDGLNNGTSHHLKLVADGSTVQIYLDGIYGGQYTFGVKTAIHFEVGTYARAQGDTAAAKYDNVKISTQYSPITATPPAVVAALNQSNEEVAVVVSPAMVRANSATVTVTSRDPSVAIPAGAVNGSLTLTFPAGGSATNTFKVTPVGVGTTTFDLANTEGAPIANSVDVTVTESLYPLLSDSFDGTAFNSAKWRFDPQGLEVSSSTTNDSYVAVSNGAARIYAISGGVGEAAGVWWGGFAMATKQGFSARPTAPVSFEIDRVAHVGTGAERRSAILITDVDRKNWVMFSDDDLNGGWVYDTSAGTLRQVNTAISAFAAAKFNDGGLHRMKLLADGATVKIYLDDIFGVSVPFVQTNGIVFQFGAFARSFPDSILATFDNALITGPMPNVYSTPTSITVGPSQTTSDLVTITFPAQLHETNTAHVVVTSSDPSVAVPMGGTGGSLTLSFAPGSPDTQTFQIARVGYGKATFTFSNDMGAGTANSLSVVVQNATASTLLTDTFNSGALSSQWTLDTAFRFEPEYASAGDALVTFPSEQLELAFTVTTNYWPGILVSTVTNFQASETDPLTFELDRVFHYGFGTGTRSGVYIFDASGSNFVWFGDLSEGNINWGYNRRIGQTGDNPTGVSTAIAAFNDSIYRDFGLHRMKVVADGRTARLYLDGVFGIELAFPFSSGLRFGIMVGGRAETDQITADFDNALITGSNKPLTPVTLKAAVQNGNVVITWTGSGVLQQSDSVPGTWTDITSATSPYVVQSANLAPKKFYRVRQ
jgi:hypothetical protein